MHAAIACIALSTFRGGLEAARAVPCCKTHIVFSNSSALLHLADLGASTLADMLVSKFGTIV